MSEHRFAQIITQRWLQVFCAALLVVGFVRTLTLVVHTPLYAYANQSDQVRVSACLDLWAQGAKFEPLIGPTPVAPIRVYHVHTVSQFPCIPVSAAAYTWIASAASGLQTGGNDDGAFDVRYLGVLYALLFGLTAGYFDRTLRNRPPLRIVHASVFLLALSDPVVTLFFNTLYAEPAAALGLYWLTAIAVASGAPNAKNVITFSVFAVSLGFSRFAHFYLPFLFSAVLLWRWRSELGLLKWGPMVAAAVVMCAQLGLAQQDIPRTTLTNRTNAIMHALTPEADDAQTFLAGLGLPQHCAKLEGMSWYLTLDHNVNVECPELRSVSMLALGKSFFADTLVYLRAIYKASLFVGTWRLRYVGEVEGEQFGHVAGPLGWSMSDWVSAAPFSLRVAILTLPLFAALGAACARHKTSLDWLLIALGITSLSSWVINVVGDGYSEMTKHSHLVAICCFTSPIALVVRTITADTKRYFVGAAALGVFGSVALSALYPVAVTSLDIHSTPPQLIAMSSASLRGAELRVTSGDKETILTGELEAESFAVGSIFGLPSSHIALRRLNTTFRYGSACEPLSFVVINHGKLLNTLRLCGAVSSSIRDHANTNAAPMTH